MVENKSGIYRILNIIDNKCYVGSAAVRFKERWSSHKSALNKNKHHSPHLQNAWNKYGEKAFIFEILEIFLQGTLSKSEFKTPLLAREQYYKDLYKSYERKYGYDVCRVAGNCLGVERTNKFKQNLRNKKIGIPRDEEIKTKISKTMISKKTTAGENNGMYGKKHSKESIIKMILNRTGKGIGPRK